MKDKRLGAFGYRVGVLHRLYLLCVRNEMAEIGFPISLVPFLTELYHCDGTTQDMLSARVNMDKASTARAVERLERKGLVRRNENKGDRREKLVYLTPKAIKRRDDFFSPLYNMSRIMSKTFSTKKRKELLDAFNEMTENLQVELGRQRRRR